MQKVAVRLVAGVLWFLVVMAAHVALPPPSAFEAGTVVPLPRSSLLGEGAATYAVDCLSLAVMAPKDDPVLTGALARFFAAAFPERLVPPEPSLPRLDMLHLDVDQRLRPDLHLGVDESYAITFVNTTVRVRAATTWAALRGLETLSQMIHQSRPSGAYVVRGLDVVDSPAVAYRGLSVDAATSYLSPQALELFIDALSHLKFNVLVLQLSNDENFAFPARRWPELQLNRPTYGHAYSWDELAHLRHYARDRGVLLGVGFALPECSSSWSALKNITLDCGTMLNERQAYSTLNPVSEAAMSAVSAVLAEAAYLLNGSILVLGGDPANYYCWAASAEVANYMCLHGLKNDYRALEHLFLRRLLNNTQHLWQRVVLSSEADPRAVGEWPSLSFVTRNDVSNIAADVRSVLRRGGHTVIFANRFNLTKRIPWESYYEILRCANLKSYMSSQEWSSVLGGSGFIQAPTESVLFTKVFAKAFALADVLWNADRPIDHSDANLRYYENNCRFFRRGIPSRDLIPSRFCPHELTR